MPAEPQPEPMMTLPRTAAQVLSGHVRLEIRCIDRMLLTFRQPRLQYGQGIHGFFCYHRGNQFVSSALMRPMTERFAADIENTPETETDRAEGRSVRDAVMTSAECSCCPRAPSAPPHPSRAPRGSASDARAPSGCTSGAWR